MKNIFIQKYLWCDHSLPFYQQWQITMTNNEALAFLAFITTLIAYAQFRTWRLVCLATYKCARPIQLLDENDAIYYNQMTQSEAVVNTFYSLAGRVPRPQFTTAGPQRGGMRSISVWFGITAILNSAAFIILGVLVPWLLTAGLQTAVVQSRDWGGCNTASRGKLGESEAYEAIERYRDCWDKSWDLPSHCMGQDGITLTRPKMHITTNVSCPFASAACHKAAEPLQLDHVNMSLVQLGINTPSNWRISHRLTCAPLDVDRFISSDANGRPWLSFRNEGIDLNLHTIVFLKQPLSSRDNLAPWHDNTAPQPVPDLHIWELWQGPSDADRSFKVHPDFRRSDGQGFVVAFNAGRSFYDFPISDPIYSAQTRHREWYMPDHEYTAMGCLDQYQFCILGPDSMCTSYTTLVGAKHEIEEKTRHLENRKTNYNMHAFVQLLQLSTVSNLVENRGAHSLVSLIRNSGTTVRDIHVSTQWTQDVQAWFEISLLSFRENLKAIVFGERSIHVGNQTTRHQDGAGPELQPSSLCNHFLLRNGDYTNINFLGLLTTLVSIALVSIASYIKEPQKSAAQFNAALRRCLARLKVRLDKVYKTVSHFIEVVLQDLRRPESSLEAIQGSLSDTLELGLPSARASTTREV